MNVLPLVPDDLWEAIEPLLPTERPKPKGGRPRVTNRAALGGIIFVLRTGCPWRLLPQELGCGSGTTCWRRLRDWQEASVWERLHTRLLNWLGDEAAIDWSQASVDSLGVRAKGGASRPAPTPPTAARPAPRSHLVVDRNGIPLAVRLSAANTHDSTELLPLIARFHRLSAHAANRAGPPSARPSCTPTRPTIAQPLGVPSAPEASPHGLLGGASTHRRAKRASGGRCWSCARRGAALRRAVRTGLTGRSAGVA